MYELHLIFFSFADENATLDIDFKALTANISGNVVIIHLTNTLEDVSNVKGILNTLKSNRLVPHLRTVLILSGKERSE